MSQLAENITASQKVVRLDEPLPSGRRFFRIDSELVEVTSRVPERTYQIPDGRLISMRRGQSDSSRATHTAGAELTPYVDAYATPSPFAGTGGEQTVRLLGPYEFTFETPSLDSGAIIASLPDGVLVIKGSVFLTEDWSLTTEIGLWVTDATLDTWSDPLTYLTTTLDSSSTESWKQEGYNQARSQMSEPGAEPPLIFTQTNAKLVTVATETPSVGAALAYVLIAEPA